MRHLGILAHSTEGAALCFLAFCQEGFRELGMHQHPDVTMDCIAMGRSMPAWEAGEHQSIRATLAESAQRLARSGAGFFVCPDNTAHLALEQPGDPLALPGLHIAEVVAAQAARDGRTRVGVLGTRYTMEGPIYPRVLAAHGIGAEIPGPGDRLLLNTIIFDELVNGQFTPRCPRRVHPGHRGPGRPGVRRRRPGLHRDPAAGDPVLLPVAGSGLHPPASPGHRAGRRCRSSRSDPGPTRDS